MRLPKGAAQRQDAVSAVVLLLVSAVGIAQAVTFPARAAAWPIWMWGLLALFSLILLAGSFRRRGTDDDAEGRGGEEAG